MSIRPLLLRNGSSYSLKFETACSCLAQTYTMWHTTFTESRIWAMLVGIESITLFASRTMPTKRPIRCTWDIGYISHRHSAYNWLKSLCMMNRTDKRNKRHSANRKRWMPFNGSRIIMWPSAMSCQLWRQSYVAHNSSSDWYFIVSGAFLPLVYPRIHSITITFNLIYICLELCATPQTLPQLDFAWSPWTRVPVFLKLERARWIDRIALWPHLPDRFRR